MDPDLESIDEKADKHLSVSQIRMYLRCPLQYEFRYIKGLKIPPSSYLSLGKSIHSVLEANFKQKIKTKEDLPLEALTDLFSDTWDSWEKETLFEGDEKPGEIKDEGIGLIKVYHKIVAPTIQPVYVEKDFQLNLDGVGVPFVGKIDLIEEKGVIIDHKITKTSMRNDAAENDLQLTAYARAYKEIFSQYPNGLRLDVMVRTKQPKIQHLVTSRSQTDVDRFVRIVRYVDGAIKSGFFYPNYNYMCPVCGYRDLCKKW